MKQKILKKLAIFAISFIFGFINIYLSADFEKEINQLSTDIAEKIVISGKKRVAVVDFTDLNGNVTEFGRFIAEEFSIALTGVGKGFTVIDRAHLKTILQEHNLFTTGLIDQQTARQLGKIAGVEALVTGTLTTLGDNVRVAVKVLDIETAVVLEAKGGNIALTEAIKILLDKEINPPVIKKTSEENKSARSTPIQSQEEENVIFEVLECKRSGSKVICSILITNKGKDKTLRLYGNDARMFDEFGNEYLVKTVQVGDNLTRILSDGYYSDFTKVFFNDIPTKTSFICEEVSPQATTVFSFILKFVGSENSFTIRFRNIPINK